MNLSVMNLARPVLLRLLSLHSTLRLAGAALAISLLSGCITPALNRAADSKSRLPLPERSLADFLAIDCHNIWRLSGRNVETNPLYWLRGMDCAVRLPPVEARSQARRWTADSWQDAFRRGILLANAKITPAERHHVVNALDSLSISIPTQVRPLYQVWRDGQDALLQLSEMRTRYAKLQQSSDSELDRLRHQQEQLRSQLALTTRKLENLTDIERQLSSRKPAGSYLQDNTHPDKEGSDAATGENDNSGTQQAAPAVEDKKP